MADFKKLFDDGLPQPVQQLGDEVAEFAKQFPTVGFEKSSMRYTE